MAISVDKVKVLREKTGAGMMDCKKALADTGGDVDKAVELLRTRGAAAAEKRIGRTTGEGLVHAYIHPGSRIGVLVEVDCETDFVARTEDFRKFVHDLALHIAAAAPVAIGREDVDAGVVAAERRIYEEQARESGKPEQVWPKIVEGRLDKWYQDFVLTEQAFVKDPNLRIGDMITELRAKLGENIQVKRFTRYQIGLDT